MSRTLIRSVVLAILLSLAMVPWGHTAEHVSRISDAPWTVRLVSFLSQLWEKHGCAIDPYGRCLPQATTSSDSEHGCGLDPAGHPVGNCQGN